MFTHNRGRRTWYVCAYISLFITMPAFSAPPEAPKAQSQEVQPKLELPNLDTLVQGKVVRIFDGDTLLIQVDGKKRRYQLLGSDAPEYLPKDRTPSPFSIESRRFIKQLLLGETVYIQHDPAGERDSANKRSAYIFRAPDMLFVNLELIRQGYAKLNTRHSTIYTDVFTHYQTRAQFLNKGIWNPAPRAMPIQFTEEPPQSPGLDQTPDSSTTDSNPDQSNSSDTPANSINQGQQIYITKYGSKYHLKGCPHLTDTTSPTTRHKINKSHEPCKTCKPEG
ncbi:MAG: thermonuclease family protein [Phycisphaerales bacterium]|nr:thermonuclease family protein [Phycisphaerales bacterium]